MKARPRRGGAFIERDAIARTRLGLCAASRSSFSQLGLAAPDVTLGCEVVRRPVLVLAKELWMVSCRRLGWKTGWSQSAQTSSSVFKK